MIHPIGLLSPKNLPIPTDAIHEWLFSNNVLDTGSITNDLTINGGVIGDIMTTDRHGNANSAFQSSNSSIYLSCTFFTIPKGYSFNLWYYTGSNGITIFYKSSVARFVQIPGGTTEIRLRANNGSTLVVSLPDYMTGIWQNLHVNFNTTTHIYIDGVLQNSGDATALDYFYVDRVFTAPSASVTDAKGDDLRIFNRELSLKEIQALATA